MASKKILAGALIRHLNNESRPALTKISILNYDDNESFETQERYLISILEEFKEEFIKKLPEFANAYWTMSTEVLYVDI